MICEICGSDYEVRCEMCEMFGNDSNAEATPDMSQPITETPKIIPSPERPKISNFFTLGVKPFNPSTFVTDFNNAYQKALNSNPSEEKALSQDSIEINRPKLIVEIKNDNNIIPSDEIAKISAARENSIIKVMRMIDSQGPEKDEEGHIIKSVAERKEEYLGTTIHEIKRKIEELRIDLSVRTRIRKTQWDDNIEKLTPEEKEEFKRRARKAAPKSESSQVKAAKKDAQKAMSKDKKTAASWLDKAMKGSKENLNATIKGCIEFWNCTQEECDRYIKEGRF